MITAVLGTPYNVIATAVDNVVIGFDLQMREIYAEKYTTMCYSANMCSCPFVTTIAYASLLTLS